MNPKIIEIVGPPGVGKSTIYDSLCKTWKPTSNWVYQEVLLSPKPHFSEINTWVEYRFRKLLGRKLAKSIPVEYGLRFVDNHPELANFYWNHLSDLKIYHNKEINKRFRAAYFLYMDFCRYQAILESICSKPCIISEGLLQKSFLIQDDGQRMLDVINRYIPLLPVPHAIIYINTPNKDVIIKRLRSRKKVIASHLGKDDDALLADVEKWQYLLNVIVTKMEKGNVPVYNIDGERPVEENVFLLTNILKSSMVLF